MNPQIQKNPTKPNQNNNQEDRAASIMDYLLESREKRKTISVNRQCAQKIKMGLTPEATVPKMTGRHTGRAKHQSSRLF